MTIPSSLSMTASGQSNRKRQPQHYQQVSYFRDPHVNAVRQTPPSTYYTPRTPAAPLVLDPQRAPPANGEMSPAVIQKLFPTSRKHSHTPPTHFLTPSLESYPNSNSKSNMSTSSLMDQDESPDLDDETAATFARSAPQAGFLMKLGSNIPEFKRRFFVLKPTTHLYYFLSPTDTQPRGCMDLDGAHICPLATLPDGRVQFAIQWPAKTEHKKTKKRVILEARSDEVGKQWIQSLKRETITSYKIDLDKANQQMLEQNATLQHLRNELDNFRMVEKDRDGAMEDAENWKRRFLDLNEALRKLTIQLSHPPETPQHTTNLSEDNTMGILDYGESLNGDRQQNKNHTKPIVDHASDSEVPNKTDYASEEEKNETDSEIAKEMMETNEADETPKMANIKQGQARDEFGDSSSEGDQDVSRNTALLDESINEEDFSPIDTHLSDTYFPTLYNVCQQLRKSVLLASTKASTAAGDLSEANAKKEALGNRMAQAEKHLCKLWEENTSIRQELNIVKKEKRVLVKEVKTLRSRKTLPGVLQDRPVEGGLPPSREIFVDEDGEQIIEDLEEQVESSLRLHKQFVTDHSEILEFAKKSNSQRLSQKQALRDLNSGPELVSVGASERSCTSRNSPIQPKVLSLFDDSFESADESEDNDGDTDSASTSCISSVGAEMGDFEVSSVDTGAIPPLPEENDEEMHSMYRLDSKHPLHKLDEAEEELAHSVTSSATATTKSIVTDNGEATTRLECPLTDVVQTNKIENRESKDNGREYHLTFYSRKIGIQFQKVPPAPTRSVLTEAMTADLRGEDFTDNQKTAGELRRIAQFSNSTKTHEAYLQDSNLGSNVGAAPPVDAVLVCGFLGFDDSGTNRRPKLGARLVAFDGISIEFGKWTFENIRKAIQTRSRPLTLTFRNDFLTTHQREILTRAVSEVNSNSRPPQRPKPSNVTIRRNSPSDSRSNASHESERFVNDGLSTDDGMSDSVTSNTLSSVASSNYTPYGVSFSANNSVMSGSNYRSFSEAGSSVVSSAVGPLMAKLMSGIQPERERTSYSYLSNEGSSSVEAMADHIDFQSGLL